MLAHRFEVEAVEANEDDAPDFAVAPGKVTRTARLDGQIYRKARADARVRARGAAPAAALIARAAADPGAPLPRDLRAELTRALGVELDGVRVHTGAAAAAAAEALGARAFAVGQDIHFAEGAYDPAGPAGRHLIAHEVAHTVQARGAAPVTEAHAISDPAGADERAADAFADAFAQRRADAPDPNATATDPAAAGTADPLPPVRAGSADPATVHRSAVIAPGPPADPIDLPYSPIEVFAGQSMSDAWDLRESFRPIDVPILIGDVPLRAGVEMGVDLAASLSAGYGPGTIDDVSIHFPSDEAGKAQTLYDWFGAWGLFPLLCLGDHDGTGQFSVPIDASAGASAKGEVGAFVGDPTASLTVAPIAGLAGSASATAHAQPYTQLDFILHPFDRPEFAQVTLGFRIETTMAFRLDAFAGVRVSFQLNVPLLEELLAEPAGWPDWLAWPFDRIPTPSHPWSKELVARWNAFQHQETLAVEGAVTAGAPGGTPTASLAITRRDDGILSRLLAALGVAKPSVPMPTEDPGPAGKGAADVEAVQAARTTAHAALATAGAAIAKAGHRKPPPAPRGPSTQSAGTGPGTGGTDDRIDKLEDGHAALSARVKRLDGFGTAVDPGVLGAVAGGYDAVAKGADELTASAKAGGGTEEERKRFELLADQTRTALADVDAILVPEVKWLRERLVQLGAGNPDLAGYRTEIVARQREVDALETKATDQRHTLEQIEDTYGEGPWAEAEPWLTDLRDAARELLLDVRALPARPTPPWDTTGGEDNPKYVRLVDGKLQLIARYHADHGLIRDDFYPSDYENMTKSWRDRKVGQLHPIGDGIYWYWNGKKSPRGDYWWDFMAKYTEAPSIDHLSETTIGNWNREGRLGLYAARWNFYNGDGDFDAHLRVVPVMENSAKGGGEDRREFGEAKTEVGVDFRGAKKR